ncbi:Universal stress protein UspA-like nucleotide-binding protein [Candidatus Terasakiella magnetica]|nr:Universal stress protein UspA-like nucleotide-binding protein [Candidatus Terasakiella magnetica]
MGYKDILVHVDETLRTVERLVIAGTLAARFQAHLVALFVRDASAVSPFITAQLSGEISGIHARNDTEQADRVRTMVDQCRVAPETHTEWRDITGDPAETVALHARYCDLTVVGQSDDDDDNGKPLADHLILSVGRPVLVIPRVGHFPTLGRRVVVAWNASREATRAIHDALPLLKRADSVHVIAINPGHGMAGHGDIPGADICLHLSRHGVNAVCEHIRSDEIDASKMLLNCISDDDADLLVMGGYGRSRMRELVLGGATRDILRHMTVPVILSH